MIFGGMLSLRCARFDSGDAFCIWLVALDDFTLSSLEHGIRQTICAAAGACRRTCGRGSRRALIVRRFLIRTLKFFRLREAARFLWSRAARSASALVAASCSPSPKMRSSKSNNSIFREDTDRKLHSAACLRGNSSLRLLVMGTKSPNKIWRSIWSCRGRNTPQVPDGYEIREIAWQERERWAEMQSNSFFDDPLQAEAFVSVFLLVARAEGYRCYVAIDRASGEFAAGGAIFISPQHRIACIAGAATRPEHRRRGLQAAMLQRRLADATAAGCDLAFMSTLLETTSCRNAERQGFIRGYERAVMVKPRIAT